QNLSTGPLENRFRFFPLANATRSTVRTTETSSPARHLSRPCGNSPIGGRGGIDRGLLEAPRRLARPGREDRFGEADGPMVAAGGVGGVAELFLTTPKK